MRTGSTFTSSTRWSPPQVFTSTMPGTLRSIGATLNWASSSSSEGLRRGESRVKWKISPRPPVTGPSSGAETPGGKDMVVSRSWTICRAR